MLNQEDKEEVKFPGANEINNTDSTDSNVIISESDRHQVENWSLQWKEKYTCKIIRLKRYTNRTKSN